MIYISHFHSITKLTLVNKTPRTISSVAILVSRCSYLVSSVTYPFECSKVFFRDTRYQIRFTFFKGLNYTPFGGLSYLLDRNFFLFIIDKDYILSKKSSSWQTKFIWYNRDVLWKHGRADSPLRKKWNYSESLILAQNKRWWRALYMQVERRSAWSRRWLIHTLCELWTFCDGWS